MLKAAFTANNQKEQPYYALYIEFRKADLVKSKNQTQGGTSALGILSNVVDYTTKNA